MTARSRLHAPADEHYTAAARAAEEAARALTAGRGTFTTEDGTTIRVNFRTPLRIYRLILHRVTPGQEHPGTSFSFQRNGRVNLGGDRGIPFREALARGHEPWATRAELIELAAQLREAW